MSSIYTFNDAQCAMAAEQTEGVSFSFPDYTVSSKSRTVYLVLGGLQLNIICPQGESPVPDTRWATVRPDGMGHRLQL